MGVTRAEEDTKTRLASRGKSGTNKQRGTFPSFSPPGTDTFGFQFFYLSAFEITKFLSPPPLLLSILLSLPEPTSSIPTSPSKYSQNQ